MTRSFLFVLCVSVSGCYATSVSGPADRSSSATIGVPGVVGVSTASYAMTPVYDACLAKYGSLPDKEQICQREAVMTSPVSGVWYCSGYGYGWYSSVPGQRPLLCNANGIVK